MLQPLNGPLDNPFKGDTLNSDYTLIVSEEKTYRDYGVVYKTTEIYGNVTVTGDLTSGNVNLINLKIIGTLIIDIGNGRIKLINTKASKILALSAGIDLP